MMEFLAFIGLIVIAGAPMWIIFAIQLIDWIMGWE